MSTLVNFLRVIFRTFLCGCHLVSWILHQSIKEARIRKHRDRLVFTTVVEYAIRIAPTPVPTGLAMSSANERMAKRTASCSGLEMSARKALMAAV